MNNPRDIATTAAVRIAGCVRHTLLLNVAGAEPGSSFPVTLALELLQLAGSFKPRGPTTVRCRPACPPPAATPRSSPLSRYRRRKRAAALANPGPGTLDVHARDHPDLLAGQETAGRNLHMTHRFSRISRCRPRQGSQSTIRMLFHAPQCAEIRPSGRGSGEGLAADGRPPGRDPAEVAER
jgi:hypothetical protein